MSMKHIAKSSTFEDIKIDSRNFSSNQILATRTSKLKLMSKIMELKCALELTKERLRYYFQNRYKEA